MQELIWTIQSFNLFAILDIALIALLLFGLSFLFRGTQSVPAFRGTLLFIILMLFLSLIPNLVAFRWVSGVIITGAAIAVPIIFQPEIRRAVERLGRAGFGLRGHHVSQYEQIIDAICTTATRLSERRHGALIVIERNDSLDEFIDTGIQLHSEISPQLLLTIFYPKTELHDGAVILRGNRVACAAAVLPLSAAHGLAQRKVGTRHRASLGMTEISDAIVVVVSEETGQISVANGGRLIRRLDIARLETILRTFYSDPSEQTPNRLRELINRTAEEWRRPPKSPLPPPPPLPPTSSAVSPSVTTTQNIPSISPTVIASPTANTNAKESEKEAEPSKINSGAAS